MPVEREPAQQPDLLLCLPGPLVRNARGRVDSQMMTEPSND